MVEYLSYKEKVVGSNPTSPIRKVLISFRAFFNYLIIKIAPVWYHTTTTVTNTQIMRNLNDVGICSNFNKNDKISKQKVK